MYNYFNGKGTIGFTCDSCGREVNGCSIVNGMKFCAKCYQETFGKDNQQNEIQQLKQQLEEKDNYHLLYELAGADETITNLKKQIEEKDKEIHSLIVDYEKRISQEQELMSNMEQQLAEKDEEIERLKVFEKAYYYNQLQASQEDIQKFQNLANQSAVNINYIVIQELEKLKTITEWKFNSITDIVDYIDQQIKELKGE